MPGWKVPIYPRKHLHYENIQKPTRNFSFQSLKKDRGYLIVYRENHPEGTAEVETWLPEGVTVRCIPLMGHGKAMTAVTGKKGRLEISLPSINDYVVYKYEIKNKR